MSGLLGLAKGICAATLIVLASPSGAIAAQKGKVTNLPIPRFVSMKAKEGNVRRGPSLKHKVDWVFKHSNMPLMVTAEHGHWRRVEDVEGQGGWVHYALLSGVRTVIIKKPNLALRIKPHDEAAPAAYAEEGAIVRLSTCTQEWCVVSADRHKGWVRKTNLWGVWSDELRE